MKRLVTFIMIYMSTTPLIVILVTSFTFDTVACVPTLIENRLQSTFGFDE